MSRYRIGCIDYPILLIALLVGTLLCSGHIASVSQDANTALFKAINKEDVQAAKAALDRGANPNARDQAGMIPLDRIAQDSVANQELARLLLDRGADPNARNDLGMTPLHFASDISLARLLIERGVDVNAADSEGSTPLMMAARLGGAQTVQLLLEHGADPNRRDKEGATALIYTGWWGQIDTVSGEEGNVACVRLLVRAGADPNAQMKSGRTALMLAADWDHPPIVAALLAARANPHLHDKRGRTALTWAARQGKDSQIVQALRTAGVYITLLDAILLEDIPAAKVDLSQPADLNMRGPYGETALMAAAEKGYLDLVRDLLARGADPNAHEDEEEHPESFHRRLKPFHYTLEPPANRGQTALMLAIAGRAEHSNLAGPDGWSGDPKDPARLEIVKALLAAGADVNATDQDGSTALIRAVETGPIEIVKTLLDHGANVDVRAHVRYNREFTPLMLAVENDRPDVVRLLLTRGAEINARSNNGDIMDETALMEATRTGRTELTQILLDHGADIHARTRDGANALMLAAQFSYGGDSRTVELLLARGADIHARNKAGNTALTYAAERGKTDPIVQILQRKGAHIGLLDAIYFGDGNIAQALLVKGADPNAVEPNGRTALMVAASQANPSLVDALLDHGARINARDRFGRTALMWAVGGDPEIASEPVAVSRLHEPGVEARVLATVQRLLARGADINATADWQKFLPGPTALMTAAANTNRTIVRFLIDHGANVQRHDFADRTALAWAEEKNQPDIVALLKQAGAIE